MQDTTFSSSAAGTEPAASALPGTPEVGFYGKLPSHGDFLRRRVSDAFVAAWDSWLQESLAASRAVLGDRWLDIYLTSPSWRFACAAGACGPAPVIGVMVPSVDRVGRYFPLTVVAELPPDADLVAWASASQPFFDAAERLVIEVLEGDVVDFETFERRVNELNVELLAAAVRPSVLLDRSAATVMDEAETGWQLPIGSASELRSVLAQLLSQRLAAMYDPLVLWWSDGSAIVEPSCVIGKGLPSSERFTALLDGAWSERRWQSIPALVALQDPGTLPAPLVESAAAFVLRSAALSNVGRVRTVNQDAFLERPEVGVWVVADGLGGHSHGEVASRMVCDALVDLVPDGSFDATIQAARQRISQVNEHLLRTSASVGDAHGCGSTVVLLLARGVELAVLWAGDSRAYRWRSGRLDQLTRDHSVAELEGILNSTAITRAVGVDATLNLDVLRDRVVPGDRYLLCSDGLTRAVSDAQLRAWLEGEDIEAAVKGLVDATLDAGAPDNVTALIVEAVPATDVLSQSQP